MFFFFFLYIIVINTAFLAVEVSELHRKFHYIQLDMKNESKFAFYLQKITIKRVPSTGVGLQNTRKKYSIPLLLLVGTYSVRNSTVVRLYFLVSRVSKIKTEPLDACGDAIFAEILSRFPRTVNRTNICPIKIDISNMERWRDRVAIVTGANSGIGKAIAVELLKSGMTVVGVARREELLKVRAE